MVSATEELSPTGLLNLQRWNDQGSIVYCGPIAFPLPMSPGSFMTTQAMEVEGPHGSLSQDFAFSTKLPSAVAGVGQEHASFSWHAPNTGGSRGLF